MRDSLTCSACGVPVYASNNTLGGWRSRLTPNEDDCNFTTSGHHEVSRDDNKMIDVAIDTDAMTHTVRS